MQLMINGLRLHYTDRGDGATALVFLHYWGGSSRTWEPVIARLSTRYRCIAPDLRGWGDSDAPGDAAFALADFAADIVQLVGTLGVQRFILVGHSMGGKIAQLLASQLPPGLAGVVLVAPAPPTPLHVSPEALAAMRAAYASRASVGGAIDHMLTHRPLPPALREQVIDDSLRGADAAKTAWPVRTSREDISAHVAAIAVPVLVVSGACDRVDPVATLRAELLPRIPQATMLVLPDTGHLSPLEAPGELADAIGTFAEGPGHG